MKFLAMNLAPMSCVESWVWCLRISVRDARMPVVCKSFCEYRYQWSFLCNCWSDDIWMCLIGVHMWTTP